MFASAQELPERTTLQERPMGCTSKKDLVYNLLFASLDLDTSFSQLKTGPMNASFSSSTVVSVSELRLLQAGASLKLL